MYVYMCIVSGPALYIVSVYSVYVYVCVYVYSVRSCISVMQCMHNEVPGLCIFEPVHAYIAAHAPRAHVRTYPIKVHYKPVNTKLGPQ